jgi:hypothetical protein
METLLTDTLYHLRAIYMTPSESRHSYDTLCILDLVCHRECKWRWSEWNR